ncbi:MAG: TIGR03790 family protein [Myxococcales bacterium]|nr:TIGR03790 family protein [Myxococcales bacterium]
MMPRLRRLAPLLALLTACAGGDDTATDGATTGASATTDASASTSSTSTSGDASTTADASSGGATSGTTGMPTSTSSTGASSGSGTATDTGGETDTGMMGGPPTVLLPKTGLVAEELGVIVNTDDPLSVAIADYYMEARQIPAENRVELSFPTDVVLTPELFAPLKAEVDAALPDTVQALALTWTTPYRVGCMSITSAFALGFDTKYCATPCNPTAPSGFYGSEVALPYSDLGIRPAMTIAAVSEEDAFALIDRGVASDDTFPVGDGYFVRTTDQARSVRWPDFLTTIAAFDHPEGLNLSYVDNSGGMGSNVIADTDGILFYFTGLASVGQIDTDTYVPGAVADHLTSFGGQIPMSGQMSAIKWLQAGATASYGTVVEPCNFPAKFPDTKVLLPFYFRGNTVIEAYWKSVSWPGEGIFIGEPLARPWGASTVEWVDGTLTITTTLLDPAKTYALAAGESADGPWTPVLNPIKVADYQQTEIVYGPTDAPFYRLDAL